MQLQYYQLTTFECLGMPSRVNEYSDRYMFAREVLSERVGWCSWRYVAAANG